MQAVARPEKAAARQIIEINKGVEDEDFIDCLNEQRQGHFYQILLRVSGRKIVTGFDTVTVLGPRKDE